MRKSCDPDVGRFEVKVIQDQRSSYLSLVLKYLTCNFDYLEPA